MRTKKKNLSFRAPESKIPRKTHLLRQVQWEAKVSTSRVRCPGLRINLMISSAWITYSGDFYLINYWEIILDMWPCIPHRSQYQVSSQSPCGSYLHSRSPNL
jgi:hypothetical protein